MSEISPRARPSDGSLGQQTPLAFLPRAHQHTHVRCLLAMQDKAEEFIDNIRRAEDFEAEVMRLASARLQKNEVDNLSQMVVSIDPAEVENSHFKVLFLLAQRLVRDLSHEKDHLAHALRQTQSVNDVLVGRLSAYEALEATGGISLDGKAGHGRLGSLRGTEARHAAAVRIQALVRGRQARQSLYSWLMAPV